MLLLARESNESRHFMWFWKHDYRSLVWRRNLVFVIQVVWILVYFALSHVVTTMFGEPARTQIMVLSMVVWTLLCLSVTLYIVLTQTCPRCYWNVHLRKYTFIGGYCTRIIPRRCPNCDIEL